MEAKTQHLGILSAHIFELCGFIFYYHTYDQYSTSKQENMIKSYQCHTFCKTFQTVRIWSQ